VTTARPELYDRLLSLRSHGITRDPARLTRDDGGWYYEMQELGFNYRLTDFQAALGLSQLRRADEDVARRQAVARRYDEAFSEIDGLVIPKAAVGISHAYHLYIIRTSRRRELYDHLRANNIFAQVHYIPVHRQPYYEALGWKAGDFPTAENYYEQCLSLPMYPALTGADQQRVIETIRKFFER
ncbi:MAG: DegT/DnrJ/EryC1/StrS family aminotransferase, partial [Rikenellaceae bacterium]|jgi:dTDP-4-amino-4,6-dideoxygalactose transaminase|nr:DegT/DnrJ/EryC1/StrS family aminotransferase [Rikenellaceae bacterium]